MQTGTITSMATTWPMVSTLSIRLLLKRFLKLSMKKESILKNYKSLRERTLRGVLGFYSNDGILSEILVACGIRIKYEWLCMLASFCII
ncbi:hypothetical protein Hanom_Chr03g00214381 [Helianthus anomalus]